MNGAPSSSIVTKGLESKGLGIESKAELHLVRMELRRWTRFDSGQIETRAREFAKNLKSERRNLS